MTPNTFPERYRESIFFRAQNSKKKKTILIRETESLQQTQNNVLQTVVENPEP